MSAEIAQIFATPAAHDGPVSPGIGVGKAERVRWVAAMLADRQLNARAHQIAQSLAFTYSDHLGWAFPSQARLAVDLGVSLPTVERAIARLARRGWIRIARKNRHAVNRYRLTWPACGNVDNSTSEPAKMRGVTHQK